MRCNFIHNLRTLETGISALLVPSHWPELFTDLEWGLLTSLQIFCILACLHKSESIENILKRHRLSTKTLLVKNPMETHTLWPSVYRLREKPFPVEHPNIVQAAETDSMKSSGDFMESHDNFMTIHAPELSEKSHSSCKHVIVFLALTCSGLYGTNCTRAQMHWHELCEDSCPPARCTLPAPSCSPTKLQLSCTAGVALTALAESGARWRRGRGCTGAGCNSGCCRGESRVTTLGWLWLFHS